MPNFNPTIQQQHVRINLKEPTTQHGRDVEKYQFGPEVHFASASRSTDWVRQYQSPKAI